MSKFLKWLLIAVALLFVGALIIGITLAGKDRKKDRGDEMTKTIEIEKEALARIRDLELNWAAGSLTVKAWDENYLKAEIRYREKGPVPSVVAEGRDLIIENGVDFWEGFNISFDWLSDKTVSMELFVPESLVFEQANIHGDAGDIRFEFPVYAENAYITVNAGTAAFDGIYAENLIETDLSAGALTIDRMTGKEVKMETGAGELKVLELIADAARVKMSAGKGKIAGTVPGMNIDLSAGTLEFTNTLELSDVWMDFNISAGTIELNNKPVKNHGRTVVNEGCRDTGKYLTATVSAGTLKLQYKGSWSGEIWDSRRPTILETETEE